MAQMICEGDEFMGDSYLPWSFLHFGEDLWENDVQCDPAYKKISLNLRLNAFITL